MTALGSDVKTRLDAAVEGGRQALRNGDPAGIKTALNELNAAYSAAGASLYEAANAAGAADGGSTETPPASEPPKEDVVEADYEIVDEEKK